MNRVILIGNLTRDPERRTTRSGVTTCSFTLAVERDHTKGRQAAVIGSWHNRSYEDKDGNKRTVSECIADDVQFLGGPRRDNAPGGYDDDYPFPDEE